MAGGARSSDEIDDRADDRSGLRASEPPHAGGKVARLGAVLDQAGDDDAGVGEQRVEIGAAARAVGEHLAGPAVRIEADRHREPRAAMLELRRFRRRGDREAAPASSHASLRLDRPQQDGERVGLVVVGGIESARADCGDHRGLVGVALAGDEAA